MKGLAMVLAAGVVVGVAGCSSDPPAEFLKIEGVTSDGGALAIDVTYKCPAETPGDHGLDGAMAPGGDRSEMAPATCDGTEHQASIPIPGTAEVGEEISVVAYVNSITVVSDGWVSDEPGVPDVPAMDEIKPLSADGQSMTVEAAG